MAAGEEAWAELMKVSFGMVGTGVQAGEMMVASGSVIGARMAIMGNAVRSPADGDYGEIGAMLHEKVAAVANVGQSLVDHWLAMQIDAAEQVLHFGSVVFGGRASGARDLAELPERWLAHGTRMMARTLETSALALAPVHLQATENARRLS